MACRDTGHGFSFARIQLKTILPYVTLISTMSKIYFYIKGETTMEAYKQEFIEFILASF